MYLIDFTKHAKFVFYSLVATDNCRFLTAKGFLN